MSLLDDIFGRKLPAIGMVHLPPLPGSPRYRGESMARITSAALADAGALAKGGVDGLIVENFNDFPYVTGQTSALCLACMASIASQVVREVDRPIGINVLFNDYISELAIAKAVGAAFIRVEVLVDPSQSDLGVLEPAAPRLGRLMTDTQSHDIKVFADIQGKNTTPLMARPLEDSARDAEERGLADCLIVTGEGTGKPAPVDDVARVKRVSSRPVIMGSGVRPDTLAEAAEHADGFIVGSYFKVGGKATNPVDEMRVRDFVQELSRIRRAK